LVARVISLKKAAEIMELEVEVLLGLLDITGIEFSYLSSEDTAIEKSW
jgi:predicted HTH domain antitoxin